MQKHEGKVIELDPTQDGHTDPAPFKFEPRRLVSLVYSRNIKALEALGGITGLLDGLDVDATRGLALGRTIEDRRRVYGPNELPVRDSKLLWRSVWLALEDRVLVSPTRLSSLFNQQ